ncbi:GntR family transcriptional regulator [Salana multivorans]|uniref:GntR family transcriptional regulator n=1 Tax=Salana multivorans TaxID=120377 RepID=A0A3N2DAN8_9MICO|nr:GntR family transcriptional regulator [Salana multivorans]MBN8883064.1 GntR family transcriptional regulator [Salana multivorans]ROR96708.1 GntR family transcriptional regulator [Salana multivorans]
MTEPLRIDLDRSSPVPLYHQVAMQIEAHIQSGLLQPGAFLENEIALAARLGISRPTARQALQELVDRGRLVRRRGVGTQVAPERIRRSVELTSLQSDLEQAGRRPSTELLGYDVLPADTETAELLEVEPGSPVVRVRRLRLADGEPLALMTNVMPESIAPSAEALRDGGLYEALRARGIVPKVARQRIGARTAHAAEARALGEPARAALLTMARTAYDDAGNVIEHGDHLYRASRYLFDTTLFAS